MIVFLACTPAYAQRRNDNEYVLARRALLQLYPDLEQQHFRLVMGDPQPLEVAEDQLRDFRMYLFKPVNLDRRKAIGCPSFMIAPVGSNAPVSEVCPAFALNARFVFDSAGLISLFRASGPAVNSDRFDPLVELINANPDWSDSHVETELRKAGVRFGPWAKNDLFRHLSLSALHTLIGDVEVESLDFQTRNQQQISAHLPAATLLWSAKLVTHQHGQSAEYLATVEPFDGKLIALTRL